MQVLVKKLHSDAKIPQYALLGDAGLDLCTLQDVDIQPGKRADLSTGLSFAIPDGHVGLIWDKSGIAFKRGIKTLAGVVDSGYRGEVRVALVNLSDDTQSFKKGDRVAQLLIQKVERAEIIESEELPESQRAHAAFGSTGI